MTNLVKEKDSDEASKDPGTIVKLHMDLANFKLGSKGTASIFGYIFLENNHILTLEKV